MDQFPTVFMGGYRKDLVDERLKRMVVQIEDLQKAVQAAKEREDELKGALAEAKERAERLEAERKPAEARWSGGSEREKKLKEELDAALKQLEQLGDGGPQEARDPEPIWAREKQAELASALRWSESLEAELKLAREERDTRAQNRLLELEHTKALNQRILELESDRERREADHRRELSRLQEQLNQQNKGCEAAGRILALAEREARTLVEEAQARAQQLERQAGEDISAKKQAAAQTLEGARTQVIRYLETFTITRDKLAVTYNELDALVGQIPPPDSGPVIELEHDSMGGRWSYPPDLET